MELIFGRRPVAEALRAGGRVDTLLVARGARGPELREILELARRSGVSLRQVPVAALDRLASNGQHQGVVAEVAEYHYCSLNELLVPAEERPLYLALDEVQDPGNLGSLLRTAECVGVTGVLLPEHRSAGITAAVIKASAGAVEHLRVARVPGLVPALEQLKRHGVWVVGLDAHEGQDLESVDWTMPLGVVLGSEGRGLRRTVSAVCDLRVRLPLAGRVRSLNVAVAGGIVLYHAWRSRDVEAGRMGEPRREREQLC